MSPSDRPRVVANCAVSADGRLAYAGGQRARLSGPDDLKRVQRLRAGAGAILVGAGTVRLDDPSLRVHWDLLGAPPGPEPLRVVLDTHGRLPPTARVFTGPGRTLAATSAACRRTYPDGVEVHRGGDREVDLPALLDALGRRGVAELLVEGGATVLASFLRAGLVDVLTVFVAPVLIGGTTAPPLLLGPECHDASEALGLALAAVERIDGGLLVTWRPAHAATGAQAPQ